ncbi:hypothetical protein AAMO2058_001059300 [Amorphochlora amoebiformis]
MAVRSVLAGFRRAGSLRLAVALPANVINRFNAPLGSRSNFNKKRLDWDLTSEDSDPPDYFDDWASDIDESFGRVNWGNQDPIIAEDGYSHAKGKRKRSIAKVRVKAGDGDIFINGVPHVEYFHDWAHRAYLLQPFEVTDTLGKYEVRAEVEGGGHTGQSQAVRQATAKALQKYTPKLRTKLKRALLLKTDVRRVQPKKWGRAKARRSFQWVKR